MNETVTDRFAVKSEGGREFELVEFSKLRRSEDFDGPTDQRYGPRWYELPDGTNVKKIDHTRFEIPGVGIVERVEAGNADD